MGKTDGQVLVSEATLTDIGEAIRAKLHGQLLYLPEEMPGAIRGIPGGVGNLQPLEARANGIYTPEAPVDGYDEVTVAVASFEAEITEDAVRLTGSGVSVSDQAVVIATRRLIHKTITANGEYDPEDDGAEAYSGVTVALPGPSMEEKTITANGVYTASDEGLEGYSKVTVMAGLGFEAAATKSTRFPLAVFNAVCDLSRFTWTATAQVGT